jgi:hypothetical protein
MSRFELIAGRRQVSTGGVIVSAEVTNLHQLTAARLLLAPVCRSASRLFVPSCLWLCLSRIVCREMDLLLTTTSSSE